MNTNLYVGNLSYDTSEDDLHTLFSRAGTVSSVNLIKDRETRRSKGFAFIEMSSQAEAEQAIKLCNGYSLDDREIKVNIARPREERPFSGGKIVIDAAVDPPVLTVLYLYISSMASRSTASSKSF